MSNTPKRKRQVPPSQGPPKPRSRESIQSQMVLQQMLTPEFNVRLTAMLGGTGQVAQAAKGTVTQLQLVCWAGKKMEEASKRGEATTAEDCVALALVDVEEGDVTPEELARNQARVAGGTEHDQDAAAVKSRVESKGLTVVSR